MAGPRTFGQGHPVQNVIGSPIVGNLPIGALRETLSGICTPIAFTGHAQNLLVIALSPRTTLSQSNIPMSLI
jgi:hypothetical protein